MSHRKDFLSFGSKRGEDFAGGRYPKYRPHLSSVCDRSSNTFQKTAFNPHDVNSYRAHNCQEAFGHSHVKPSSSGCGPVVGNTDGVYRCHMSTFGDHTSLKNDNPFSFNEKQTMQSLNSRLASYLDNVKSLEEENVMLEKKICECYEKKACSLSPNSNQYFQIISDLQNQVVSVATHNASLVQQIEDNHIEAEHFRKKHDMELTKRISYEDNICYYYGLLEDITFDSQSLVMQIQHLEEDLLQINKISEEEIICLQSQLGTRVNVDVELSPSIDLNAALFEIRKEYESLMEWNLRDVENMFLEMTSNLSCKVISEIEEMQLFSNEVTDLKLCVQILEIELTKQVNMISVLECTLTELRGHYRSHLDQLQSIIDIHESQLSQIQSNLKLKNGEHKIIMDVTTRLEKEINMFKQLLEAHALMHHLSERRDGVHPGKLEK